MSMIRQALLASADVEDGYSPLLLRAGVTSAEERARVLSALVGADWGAASRIRWQFVLKLRICA